jgi:hypothetical protein
MSSLGDEGVYPHTPPQTAELEEKGARPMQQRARGRLSPHLVWAEMWPARRKRRMERRWWMGIVEVWGMLGFYRRSMF